MTALLIVCVVVVGGRDRRRRRWGSILWRGGGTGRLGGGWGGGVKGEHGEGGSDKGGLEGGERKWAFRVATAWAEVRLRLAREEEVA